jgi:hypothetical protein
LINEYENGQLISIELATLDELSFLILDLHRPQDVSIVYDFLTQDKRLTVCMSYMRSTSKYVSMSFHQSLSHFEKKLKAVL